MTKIEKIESSERNRLTKDPRRVDFCLTNSAWQKMDLREWHDYVQTIYSALLIESDFTARIYRNHFLWNGDNMFKRDKICFTIFPSGPWVAAAFVELLMKEVDKAYGFIRKRFSVSGYTYSKFICEVAEEQHLFVSQKFKDYVQKEIDKTNELFDEGMMGKEWIKEQKRKKKNLKKTKT